jgi:hypothetical protein
MENTWKRSAGCGFRRSCSATGEMKQVSGEQLESGEPAVLNQFTGVANCSVGTGTGSDDKLFKPFMQFENSPDAHPPQLGSLGELSHQPRGAAVRSNRRRAERRPARVALALHAEVERLKQG